MTNLLPCPFCEGEAAPLDENDHTSCTNIACGSTDYMHVDAWNGRVGAWRPIETAPLDGTSILVALHEWNDPANKYVFEVVAWDGGCWSSEAYPIYPPTHWMPIPPGPRSPEIPA